MNKVGKHSRYALIPLFVLCVGCKSVDAGAGRVNVSGPGLLSGTTDKTIPGSVSPSSVSGSGGTILAVPSNEQLKKNNLDTAVLGYLETGSPESIRVAVDRINADIRGMTDQNRIALALAGELMNILYPLEKILWTIPPVPDSGSYIGAIRSARMGVYDYSAGNSDFFSLVLPSLVMVVSTSPGDYYPDAETALVKANTMNSSSVLPSYFLALLAERQGRTIIADEYYKRAWEIDGSCYPAGIGYVRSLIRKGNGNTALEIARKLSSRYPDSLQMTQYCAEAAFVVKDWTSADPYVLKVLKAQPENTQYLLMRARILIENKEYLKANSLLDAFATLNRTDKNYLLLRSRVIREWNKNLVSAINILQEAQRLYPDDIEVLLASAEVCYQSGQAINQLGGRDFVNFVIAKDSENKTALSLLVTDYIDQSDWKNAVKNGEKLVSLDSADNFRSLLLRSYIGDGQTAKAVTLAKSLYSVSNPAEDIIGLYLQSLVESGDTRTAATVIASRMGGASSSLKSVLYYYESRLTTDPDVKLSSLRSSLLSDPRNSSGLFAMYQWYLEKTDYRKAEYYLKQVIALNPSNKKYTQLLSNLAALLAR